MAFSPRSLPLASAAQQYLPVSPQLLAPDNHSYTLLPLQSGAANDLSSEQGTRRLLLVPTRRSESAAARSPIQEGKSTRSGSIAFVGWGKEKAALIDH